MLQNSIILRHSAIPATLVANPKAFGGQQIGDCLVGDLRIEAGQVVGMQPTEQVASKTYDLAGRMLLPKLVEAHCHLDKCHTVGRLGPVGGDLHAAISAQQADKAHWTYADLKQRAERGLAEFDQAGCGVIRSHIDWDTLAWTERRTPIAWDVLGDLGEAWADRLLLQRSALIPLDFFANRQDRQQTEVAIQHIAKASNAVLGIFSFDQPNKRELFQHVFELASHYQLALDVHVDEGLSAGLDGLEIIAQLVLETGFNKPVLCGHACSLSNLKDQAMERVITLVKQAGINIVSLPTTNLYLQDRQPGSPQRRGMTRVRELVAAGVPVAIGSDNVGDAFCPLGAHDPMASLAIGALTAHLDPPYGQWLPMITTTARQAVGLAPLFVDQAKISDLLISAAHHTTELVAGAERQPLLEFISSLPE